MIEKNLNKIKSLAKSKNDHNCKFRSFLKMSQISDKKLDSIVKQITLKIMKEINCKECMNCCKVSSPCLEKNEIDLISNYLKITKTEFIEQYLNMNDREETDEFPLKYPCPFFKNDSCAIEEIKPKICKEYPYLLKKNFRNRLLGVIDNYEICPIVFNVYEELKQNFKKKGN